MCFREASFRRAFNEFDTDGSGYIDNKELMVIRLFHTYIQVFSQQPILADQMLGMFKV